MQKCSVRYLGIALHAYAFVLYMLQYVCMYVMHTIQCNSPQFLITFIIMLTVCIVLLRVQSALHE